MSDKNVMQSNFCFCKCICRQQRRFVSRFSCTVQYSHGHLLQLVPGRLQMKLTTHTKCIL